MNKKGPIYYLVGMMGAGKSTVGALLARELAMPFFDADVEIARRAGATIPEIFEREGEAGFRKRERETLLGLASAPAVVALGGGALSSPETIEQLEAAGELIYLEAPIPVLLDRIGHPETRPLLAGLSRVAREKRLAALLDERRGCYERARFRIDAQGSAKQVVSKIVRALEAGSAPERRKSVVPRRSSEESRRKQRIRVPVELSERRYAIEIGTDWLEEIGERAAEALGAERIALITVPSVSRRYAPALTRGLKKAGVRVGRIVVPDGDSTKNLKQLGTLYEAFLDQGLDRQSAVVTLGGGVVGDLGGFAAATFLRGIPFAQVPTTVLAMVDASIGGKTGVNLKQGKNLVGAFHQPRGVFIDVATLRTLPPRQRAAGTAEIIKAAAIWDAELFDRLERDIKAFLDLDPAVVLPVLERACAIKAEVVARDEREGGLRRLLNFGHTLAHAVEKHARYRGVLHGEAVAMGMVFAAERSEALGFAPAGTKDRLEGLIEKAGLPTRMPSRPRQAYLTALSVDKKKEGDRLHFVVSKGIGRAATASLAPRDILPPGWKP